MYDKQLRKMAILLYIRDLNLRRGRGFERVAKHTRVFKGINSRVQVWIYHHSTVIELQPLLAFASADCSVVTWIHATPRVTNRTGKRIGAICCYFSAMSVLRIAAFVVTAQSMHTGLRLFAIQEQHWGIQLRRNVNLVPPLSGGELACTKGSYSGVTVM